jgi:hypothetical protein
MNTLIDYVYAFGRIVQQGISIATSNQLSEKCELSAQIKDSGGKGSQYRIANYLLLPDIQMQISMTFNIVMMCPKLA